MTRLDVIESSHFMTCLPLVYQVIVDVEVELIIGQVFGIGTVAVSVP